MNILLLFNSNRSVIYRNSHWPRSWQDLKPIRAGVTANLGECWITEINKLYLFNFFLLRTVSVPEFARLEWRTINTSSKRGKMGGGYWDKLSQNSLKWELVSERASDFPKKKKYQVTPDSSSHFQSYLLVIGVDLCLCTCTYVWLIFHGNMVKGEGHGLYPSLRFKGGEEHHQ